MPSESAVSEFDALLAEIAAEIPEASVELVEDPGETPCIVSTPVLRLRVTGDTLAPAQPVAASTKPKPEYKTDDNKIKIPGAPFETTLYSRGYVSAQFVNGWRFSNKFCMYLEELEMLENWFGSDEYKTWKAKAIESGLKNRKTS